MTRSREAHLGGAVVLSLLILGVTAWAVAMKSPVFEVRELRVEGTGRLSPREVAGLAGVEEGSNLLLLPIDEVASSVRSNPWVADVTVRRDLPSTLVVRVRERSPIGWVAGPEGGAVVAEDGTVLGRRARPGGLARVGRTDDLPDPGGAISGIRPQLRVAASLPPRLRREVVRVVRRGNEIVLRLRSGPRILYGEPEGLPAKRAALASLLAWMEREGVEAAYVDVRAPRTPAVRPVDHGDHGEDPPGG